MKNDPNVLDEHEWEIVNDEVMGGISDSTVTRTETGTWLFKGNVSLENNGGFASAQAHLQADFSAFEGVVLQIKGDGNRYGFNLRSQGMRRLSYRAYFETNGDWQEISIHFDELQPTAFGDLVPDAPPLDLSQICMVGFIISDKQAGSFSLEIERINTF